jgi:hypothetical protein
MSLNVEPKLLEQATQGEIDENAFVDCVRTSLPYAFQTISGLVAQLRAGDREFVDNQTPPPDEQARGQLLRALASDAMKEALERHFNVKLAFQNCHRVAVFSPKSARGEQYRAFTSPRAQILNQRPELRDC